MRTKSDRAESYFSFGNAVELGRRSGAANVDTCCDNEIGVVTLIGYKRSQCPRCRRASTSGPAPIARWMKFSLDV